MKRLFELEDLKKQLDKALTSRREWMEKVTIDRQEIARLKAEIDLLRAANASFEGGMDWRNGLITELCDELDAYTPDAEGGYRKAKELIQRARDAKYERPR
jgi:hypothetical protein